MADTAAGSRLHVCVAHLVARYAVPIVKPIISVFDDPPRGVRVGRCDGNKQFVALVGSIGVILFVFDHAGRLLRSLDRRADERFSNCDRGLGAALNQFEPYAFESVSRVQPFTCTKNPGRRLVA
jgi:hypothetical protein